MRGFSFHEAAEVELAEAISYYEARSSGLGKKFFGKVRDIVDRILEFPEASPVVRGTLRRQSLSGFPYSLVYAEEANEIRIYAVMHHRRRPGYWVNRI